MSTKIRLSKKDQSMVRPFVESLIRMKKALTCGKGVFLSHEELRRLHDSNPKLPWDAVDEFILDDDDHLVVSFTRLKTFTKDDIAALNRINDKLTELELNLKQEVRRQLELLNERLADKESWISDYEVELSIKFYLKESDPRYNDDIDNIVFEEKYLLPCASASHKIGAEDWFKNTQMYEPYRIDEILERPVCELFHIIFDHAGFPQAEAKNTGTIWIDILVMPQMEIIL
jgi:hypothetical protein